jgi:hypothetical protein
MGLPLKKMLLATALSGLVLLAVAQLCFVKLADANPLPYSNYILVSPLTKPSITILSPAENNTLHNSDNLTISFSATIKSESVDVWILSVRYNTSWQSDNITVWERSDYNNWLPHDDDIHEYSGNLSLTGIPEGNQTVTIIVYGGGSYSSNMVLYFFNAPSYYTVNFTVDTVPPEVSVLELDNKTFVAPEVPLNFTVNESFSKISYVLDNQDNVTIDGNTTLTGLSNGLHDVTVYAWDAAGNVCASETIHFSVAQPFPTTMVIAPMASAVVIGVGLLVYFKKRKH